MATPIDPANKSSYVAATVTAALGYLTLNQWAIVVGIVVTLVVGCVQVWSMVSRVHSQRRIESETRRHNRKIRDIERGDDDRDKDNDY